VAGWDQAKPVSYRVRHGERVSFAGLVRTDPAAGERITVAVLSCNSSRTPGERQELVAGLRAVDLDCNAWPHSGRNAALRILKSAKAFHLCGDQHLAVVVKHGIDEFGDGLWPSRHQRL